MPFLSTDFMLTSKLFSHHLCCYRNNVQHVPVVLAGDFNGCPKDAVYNYVVEKGFMSSYKTVHNKEPCVTHRVYNGEEILVDYIFYRCVWLLYKNCSIINGHLLHFTPFSHSCSQGSEVSCELNMLKSHEIKI